MRDTLSERDVVFTPFMRRVRATLDGDERAPAELPLHSSELRRRANAVDAWVGLRARGEQVVAEANAMLEGRAELIDLADESGTLDHVFTLRRGSRWACIRLHHSGASGFLELERWTGPSAAPVEPTDLTCLEDLIVQMIDPTPRGEADGRTEPC